MKRIASLAAFALALAAAPAHGEGSAPEPADSPPPAASPAAAPPAALTLPAAPPGGPAWRAPASRIGIPAGPGLLRSPECHRAHAHLRAVARTAGRTLAEHASLRKELIRAMRAITAASPYGKDARYTNAVEATWTVEAATAALRATLADYQHNLRGIRLACYPAPAGEPITARHLGEGGPDYVADMIAAGAATKRGRDAARTYPTAPQPGE